MAWLMAPMGIAFVVLALLAVAVLTQIERTRRRSDERAESADEWSQEAVTGLRANCRQPSATKNRLSRFRDALSLGEMPS